MEDKRGLAQPETPNVAPENDGGTISVQVLEFKTNLLEAVEELHIHRDAETRYEQQICKLVLEKQELEWQKESLQSQISRMSNENSESLAAIKKQFQAQIRRIEGEKGKIQLAAELKDKEITSLKEELKQLQLLKYSLEKKLAELEQKLQLQTQLKDSHLSQLGEAERRFAAVSRQCGAVRQAHEKLEQNVEEAMRINKKLTSVNRKQESTVKALKEDVGRLHKELLTLKVSSACRPGEEHLQNVLKDQELQQFQHKLLVETEMNRKLRQEAVRERAEKEEVLRSRLHTQQLLQMQTETLIRAEQDLHTLRQDYQVLKTEHELNLERVREKQNSFERLRDEYENLKLAWDKKLHAQTEKTETDRAELKAVNKTYEQLQNESKHLCVPADPQDEDLQISEIDLQHRKNKTEEHSLSRTVSEINLEKMDSLHGDVSVEPEENLGSPHKNREPVRCPVKSVPDESSADCQRPGPDVYSHDENSLLEVSAIPEVSPTKGSEVLDLRLEEVNAMTGQLSNLCAETKMIVCESELSGPETLEQNLCISEATKPQTSDKHTDSQTESKEITEKTEFLQWFPQTEDQPISERLSEDRPANSNPQHTADIRHVTENLILDEQNPCEETTHQEPQPSPDSVLPAAAATLDERCHESVLATADAMEVISENKDQKDVAPTFDFCTQTFSPHPNIRNPSQDSSSPDGFPKANDPSDVDHKCMSVVGASKPAERKRYRPSFAWDTFLKDQKNTPPICGDGSVDHSVVIRNRKSRMTPPPSTFTANMKTTDKLETPNKRPHQKSDSRDEWNEIKQSCSEMSVEKENRVIISCYSSAANSLGQTPTNVLTPKPRSLETDSLPVSEEIEQQNQSDTVAQTEKIEEFVSSESLTPQKIRKIDQIL